MSIKIKCLRRQGIFRAGVFHHAEEIEHPDGRFTPEQIALLQAEPMLEVTLVKEKQREKAKKAADIPVDLTPSMN